VAQRQQQCNNNRLNLHTLLPYFPQNTTVIIIPTTTTKTDTMKLVLSTAVLATILAPAFSFSYLDSIGKSNPVSYSAPGGGSPSNGASYLDALTSPASSAPTGKGIGGYLSSLTGGSAPAPAAAAPVAAAPAPAAPAPVAAAPASSTGSGVTAGSSGSYLSILGSGATAINGGGIRSYLDNVARNAPVSGGAGIPTYKDAIASSNVVTGTGSGMNTYTDNLSGGKSSSGKSYSPFGGSSTAAFKPSFTGSAGGQEIGFTLEASDLSELVKGMSGGGTIRLSGSIDNISFN
jgi:hypothetical protein